MTVMDARSIHRFRESLLGWYDAGHRDLPWRRTREPYPIWVSEVMLQQTQVATVIPYYERFMSKYPDVSSLARADQQEVLKSWEKMGYYARARNLHRAACIVVERHGGKIPTDYAAFRELPGVGDYIASAVTSIAYDAPHAAVDGNVKRVLARMFCIDAPANSAKGPFAGPAKELLDLQRPGAYNQAMMELGATVCRPATPACESCPVTEFCEAAARGEQLAFPVRTKRRQVPRYHIAVGVVRKGDRILITRRRPEGLLGGLWEFPGGKVTPGEAPESACRREIAEETNLEVSVTRHLARIDHAYTHFKIDVDVYSCEYLGGDVSLDGPVDYRWIVAEEIDGYAFPGANHKFLPAVKKELSSS